MKECELCMEKDIEEVHQCDQCCQFYCIYCMADELVCKTCKEDGW